MRLTSALFSFASLLSLALAQANCTIVSTVTVVSGDTLGAIATAAGVTLDQILYVNPTITNANFIDVGQVINIPDAACVAPVVEEPVEPTATCVNGTESTYTVVAGDTFTIIANEKLGITLAALVAANPQVPDVNVIDVGDVLNVPLCSAVTEDKAAEKTEKKLYYDCLTTKVSNSKRSKSKAKANRMH